MNLFALIRDGDTFVDIGANVGLYTHSFSRLINIYPNFRLISVEPHPSTFSRLSFRQAYGVAYLNSAISDVSEELLFVDGAVSHVFAALEKANTYHLPGQTSSVRAIRLDDLGLTSSSIVLKIDVEGLERRVLDGAAGLLSDGRIRIIYLDGYDDPGINDFLIGHGFQLYDGRSLRPVSTRVFSLLAIRHS
jgi:FkbM family methyltransferase